MLEKGLLVVIALVGGYASITATLPATLIALFGNPAVLKSTSPSIESIIEGDVAQAIGQSLGTGLAGPIGGAIGNAIGQNKSTTG